MSQNQNLPILLPLQAKNNNRSLSITNLDGTQIQYFHVGFSGCFILLKLYSIYVLFFSLSGRYLLKTLINSSNYSKVGRSPTLFNFVQLQIICRVVYLILLASLRRTSSLLHGKYNLHGWANFPRPVRAQRRYL